MGDRDAAWAPDVMEGFVRRELGSATLVRPGSTVALPKTAVLHVHGYNDYFFQRHLARAIADAGHAFYAVDLSRAGRSLRSGDIPHFMTDVAQQGEDMTAAADAVARELPGVPLVVHAHSTGGLSAVIWAHDHPHRTLSGLALNSPLFGLVSTQMTRLGASIALGALRRRPLTVLRRAPSPYAARLHVSGGGEWDFDTSWKRPQGVPVRAGWLLAVRRAIARISRGLEIPVPVLVARSDTSGPDLRSNLDADHQDTVVDVRAIERLAPRLGAGVEQCVIEDGVHDLSLSAPDVRARYLSSLIGWLDSLAE